MPWFWYSLSTVLAAAREGDAARPTTMSFWRIELVHDPHVKGISMAVVMTSYMSTNSSALISPLPSRSIS